MNKAKEKKLRKHIVDLLKSKRLYEESDLILIEELVDFLKISDYWKSELTSNPDSWQALTTITMCSKQIQSLMVKLSLTPSERAKIVTTSIDRPFLEDVIKEVTSK